MFLRPLSTEQKSLFLGLAEYAASANNVIVEAEQNLLNAYADEMGIQFSDKSDLELEELLKRIKKISTSKEINQIAFEIVGMMMSDMSYDDAEKAFMKKMSDIFELEQSKIDQMFEYVNEYLEVIHKINVLMFE